MQITSLNPKNQKAVDKAVKYLDKYNSTSSARDRAYDNDEEKEGRKLDRKCEDLFDKYLTACDELPKRERENLEDSFYNNL